MRWTALRLSPLACAIERVLQCVASAGLVSSVRVSTRSTCASVIVRGAPGRGSSSSPSRRRARKRWRHLPTVCLVSRSSCATTVLVRPAAHPRISRARWATACAVFARRAQRSSVSRSSIVRISGGIGRPVRIGVLPSIERTFEAHNLFHDLPRQDTSRPLHARCSTEGMMETAEELFLHPIPEQLRQVALDALEAGSVTGFLRKATSNQYQMDLVYWNVTALQARGLYERALLEAFIASRTNHRRWLLVEIRSLFDQADRARLRAAGHPLPG